jgi:antitoxin MazE
MSHPVLANIVRIGNSRGLRIPKALLEQLDLGERVAMSVEGDQLVIRAARRPREGWDEQFRLAQEQGEDEPLEEFPPTAFDKQEWEW